MDTMANTRQAGRAGRRGYTAVEVLSAMTIFAIGAAGVIGMQRVTIQGGQDARRLDVATNIAHEWIARLQRDSMAWTLPSNRNKTTENLTTNTLWLKDIGKGACTAPSYCDPPTVTGADAAGRSAAFDVFGRDRPSGSGDHAYCVQYRFWWGQPLGSAPQFSEQATIRAEIRVLYSRLERAPIGECGDYSVNPDTDQGRAAYHVVYAVTTLRSNQESPL